MNQKIAPRITRVESPPGTREPAYEVSTGSPDSPLSADRRTLAALLESLGISKLDAATDSIKASWLAVGESMLAGHTD